MLTVYQDKGTRVSQEQLPATVTTPRGSRSDRWQGIPHATLVDAMGEAIADVGYKVKSTELVLSGNKEIDPTSCLVGGFELEGDGYGGLGQSVTKCVAFIHDNGGTRSLQIYTGGTVAICANGLVSAEDESRRKHTIGLRLRDYLAERFSGLPDMFAETQQRLETLTEQRIGKLSHQSLMIGAARSKILSWSALGKLDDAWLEATSGKNVSWEQPDHQGKWPFHGNAWDWLNAGTHILKAQSPVNQVAKIKRLESGVHQFITAS